MHQSYESMFRAATCSSVAPDGVSPHPYQRRLGEEGLPELLEVPTGMGKTLAVTTAWLYRRRFHPDAAVRASTPRRLVFVLPMRVLVEQTQQVIAGCLSGLDLIEQVPLRVVMGGEPMTGKHDWRMDVDRDSIIIGTLDMIVSRCLNRGYGDSRYLWPIDFGLLNADCQFVFDELQLMGPALATTRQLHGLRAKLGEAAPCRSTWMSATVKHDALQTFDAPYITSRVGLESDDLATAAVASRISAPKMLVELIVADSKKISAEIASTALEAHRSGTLTLVVVNTVERARGVHRTIAKQSTEAELVLLHSRFRPGDRARQVDNALKPIDGSGSGRIVVSTQVVEAGVDISSATLITELAPWPSIVQRAGRCNRDGLTVDAKMIWVRLTAEQSLPYEPGDLAASAAELSKLTGTTVNSEILGAATVATMKQIQPVLRRRDLLELFDTLPDVTGNDVDVSRFIRESDDLDVAVAWRTGIDDVHTEQPMPGKRERCNVPVRAFREWVKKHGGEARQWDSLQRRWVSCRAEHARPGLVVIIDASSGGYLPDVGWSPDSNALVETIHDDPGIEDLAIADDPVSVGSSWVTLRDHLDDTRREVQEMLAATPTPGLSLRVREAVVDAARLHDIGKAHEVFRGSIERVASSAGRSLPVGEVFAKSGVPGAPLRHAMPNFRHELASALCLLGEGAVALGEHGEHDLVVYLVAAHHGRVRMGIRGLPSDDSSRGVCAMGVVQGDHMPVVRLVDGEVPASILDLKVMELGGSGVAPSWVERALGLRDRGDLGPFRLGFLEAIVRLADWRASASPTAYQDLEV